MSLRLQTVQAVPLDLRAEIGAINVDKRTVELTFATPKADVLRYDWETGKRFYERLSLDPKHVRMGRLESGTAPLLDTHSAWSLASQIGVVDKASVNGKRGEATVRFSKRADVEPIYQDVLDRIVRNNSVGYRVFRFEDTNEAINGFVVRIATDWEPYEISMVPMGADAGARTRGAKTSKEIETNPCVIVRSGLTDGDRARNFRLAMARAF